MCSIDVVAMTEQNTHAVTCSIDVVAMTIQNTHAVMCSIDVVAMTMQNKWRSLGFSFLLAAKELIAIGTKYQSGFCVRPF
jgi:hypothetical protein